MTKHTTIDHTRTSQRERVSALCPSLTITLSHCSAQVGNGLVVRVSPYELVSELGFAGFRLANEHDPVMEYDAAGDLRTLTACVIGPRLPRAQLMAKLAEFMEDTGIPEATVLEAGHHPATLYVRDASLSLYDDIEALAA